MVDVRKHAIFFSGVATDKPIGKEEAVQWEKRRKNSA